MTPDHYAFDDFFARLINEILAQRGDDQLPITRNIFGQSLTYDRVQHLTASGDVASWTYTIAREGSWCLTMENRPADAERFKDWKAVGDLEAAHRDLSLLKLAIT